MLDKKTTALIISVLLLITLTSCGTSDELSEEKLKMNQYLLERYGQEFVVNDINYTYDYFGSPKMIKAIAHSKEYPELKFEIKKYADGRIWKEAGMDVYYNESFIWSLWSKQAETKMDGLMSKSYFRTIISFPPHDIYPNIYGKAMDLTNAKKMFKNKISLDIYCAFFDDRKEDSLDKILSIINAYKDYDYHKISLVVAYFDGHYQKSIEKNFNKYMNSMDPDYKKTITKEYRINDIKNVNSLEQLEEYAFRRQGL
ncbi:hypothetical protein [Heliophilum fasciatum]|uniref:Uncharacterized protein n=1 Tax=Heliophilum fasciatum TaxID=35700 RepID=A0A4R2QVA1_9FIRM|nr:hypothetical protein [Heliophilum fasciatum]MCW2279537.1 hypothetical protein [Heliophilum fasciatum]TCP53960.1 hypothetical protein EDD73_1672 [Heliophilum fasciatum]